MEPGTDAGGWQYARDFGHEYEQQQRWNSGVRRRRWLRHLRIQDSGPWLEVGGPRLRDVSVKSWDLSSDAACSVWAVGASGGEVLRKTRCPHAPA